MSPSQPTSGASAGGRWPISRWIGSAAVAALLIQLVPYGRGHDNPPISEEPVWDAEQTRTLFHRACGDCHSNETTWPWYSHVAPVSWLVQYDVEEGREHFNVSTYDRPRQDADEAAELVRQGEMPPWFYLPAHPEARLDDAEKQALVQGLVRTFGDEYAGAHP
ncbi:MAG: heme-binding domain-containing protein [Myxococcota bacterium]